MKRCLLLISIVMLAGVCHAQALTAGGDRARQYAMSLTFHQAGLTGICLLRNDGDRILGCVVNEFGIKAFDFIYDKQKGRTKLTNVLKMLDKWYLKRVAAADFSCLLRGHNKRRHLRRRTLVCEGGKVRLENRKYDITYTFEPIDDVER